MFWAAELIVNSERAGRASRSGRVKRRGWSHVISYDVVPYLSRRRSLPNALERRRNFWTLAHTPVGERLRRSCIHVLQTRIHAYVDTSYVCHILYLAYVDYIDVYLRRLRIIRMYISMCFKHTCMLSVGGSLRLRVLLDAGSVDLAATASARRYRQYRRTLDQPSGSDSKRSRRRADMLFESYEPKCVVSVSLHQNVTSTRPLL